MSEDKIEFAKDLVASNIRKTNEKIIMRNSTHGSVLIFSL